MLVAWNYIMRNGVRILQMMSDSVSIYDQALYFIRQAYFKTKKEGHIKTYSYVDLWNLVKTTKSVTDSKLDINIKQYVVKQVINNWNAYIRECMEYKIHPEKFEAAPKLPKYLSHKKQKYNIIKIDRSRFRYIDYKNNTFKIPCSDVVIQISKQIDMNSIHQVTIQKFYDKIKVNIIYLSLLPVKKMTHNASK